MAYVFIAPFFIVFGVFMLFPIAFSLYLSFLNWNGIMAPQFVGMQYYYEAVRDPQFLNALRNTAVYAVVAVTLSTAVGLAMALFLNRVRFLKRFFRGIFFAPAVVSLVVVSLLWKLMLNSDYGLVSDLMRLMDHFHLVSVDTSPSAPVSTGLLNHPNHWVPLITVVLVNVWVMAGFNTVIFLAGLQGIPAHLYDVSRIDGASPFSNLRYITLPLLRPTMFFVVLISTIDCLQVFVLPNVMNPDADSTMTVVYYLFRNAFQFYKMGYASAVAYLLFGITLVFALALRAAFGREIRWSVTE